MENENISRQEAIKKMGKYGAFIALGTIIMLNPKKAQAQSPGGVCGKNRRFGVKKTRKGMFNN